MASTAGRRDAIPVLAWARTHGSSGAFAMFGLRLDRSSSSALRVSGGRDLAVEDKADACLAYLGVGVRPVMLASNRRLDTSRLEQRSRSAWSAHPSRESNLGLLASAARSRVTASARLRLLQIGRSEFPTRSRTQSADAPRRSRAGRCGRRQFRAVRPATRTRLAATRTGHRRTTSCVAATFPLPLPEYSRSACLPLRRTRPVEFSAHPAAMTARVTSNGAPGPACSRLALRSGRRERERYRGAQIRTGDLSDPNGARYQAAPHPETGP